MLEIAREFSRGICFDGTPKRVTLRWEATMQTEEVPLLPNSGSSEDYRDLPCLFAFSRGMTRVPKGQTVDFLHRFYHECGQAYGNCFWLPQAAFGFNSAGATTMDHVGGPFGRMSFVLFHRSSVFFVFFFRLFAFPLGKFSGKPPRIMGTLRF